MKMCSFTQNMGLLPLIAIILKINSTLWRFRANPLRIHWDIDENVQFYSKHGVVTPHCDHLEKLTLLCEGIKPIR